jgi:hypothetical protein
MQGAFIKKTVEVKTSQNPYARFRAQESAGSYAKK